MKRLIPKSRFSGRPATADSVRHRIKISGTDKTNIPLLTRCQNAWDNLSDFRATRLRNFRYVFGDQWGDIVTDKDGNMIKERERIAKRTGGVALQNNHLFKIVNTLAGLYAKTATLPVCFARKKGADAKSQMMTDALQTNWENNLMKDVLTSEMIEFICGGCSVVAEEWSSHDHVDDSYTYVVNPSYFFYESKANDPRHWDDSLIGEIRDYTLGELAAVLAESEYDYRQLKEIYSPWLNRADTVGIQQTDRFKDESFDTPPSADLCRTYHVWTLEYKPRYRCVDIMDPDDPLYRIEIEDLPIIKKENEERIRMGTEQGLPLEDIPLIEYSYIIDLYWHFQMLSPDGRVLTEYDTPYEHKSHPYVYKLHYLVNGKTVPFISVIIDQQRYINRLIMLNDLAIQSAVKGVKMIPKDVIPEGMSNREFAEQFVEIGGFIFYEPSKNGSKPEVITSNSTNIGTAELLQLQLSFINDITSVSEALQGKTPSGSTAASRYAMETQNSTTSIATLLTKFSTFEGDIARKKMKTIHQYYQSPRNISMERSSGYATYSEYDPKEVQDIDFKVSIKESAESPVARMMLNDTVKELWMAGAISAEQMLSLSYYPGSEQILQSIQSNKQAVEQGNEVQGIPMEQMSALNGQVDENAVNKTRQALMSA